MIVSCRHGAAHVGGDVMDRLRNCDGCRNEKHDRVDAQQALPIVVKPLDERTVLEIAVHDALERVAWWQENNGEEWFNYHDPENKTSYPHWCAEQIRKMIRGERPLPEIRSMELHVDGAIE